MNTELTIEMASFTLADGISEDTLFAASERLEREFLSESDGYLGRALVRKDKDKWADIVFWKSEAHASNAMETAAASAACRSYFKCMKAADHSDPNNGIAFFRTAKTYGSFKL